MCPDIRDLDNGIFVRPYFGPYWDQHATDGIWDGYTYYYGITTYQKWDENSRLTARIDGEGHKTRYLYDDLNRQTQEVYPDGERLFKYYDRNDNTIQVYDPNTNIIVNEHDELDRLIDTNVTLGPGVVGTDHQAFGYDGLGRKTWSLDENTTTRVLATWTYTSLGDVVAESVDGYTVTGRFDGEGNRIMVLYPNGRLLNHTYNADNQLQNITDLWPPLFDAPHVEEPLVNYTYVGRMVFRNYANGVNRTVSYDDAGENATLPTRIQDTVYLDGNESLLFGLNYSYNAVHRKTSVEAEHNADGSETYALDPVYRLTDYEHGELDSGSIATPSASGLAAQNWTLTDGNDWNYTQVDGELHNRSHNARHQLVNDTAGTTSWYTYDANGNMLTNGNTSYQWDFKNRLVSIQNSSGGLHRYVYDAGNRRVLDEAPEGVTRFVLDGRQVIEERNAAGDLLRQYVYGPGIDEVVFMDVNLAPETSMLPIIGPLLVDTVLGGLVSKDGYTSERYWYHLNDIHSTIAITNDTGGVVEAYEYSPYGLPFIYTPGANRVVDWGGDDVVLQGGTSPLGNRILYTGRSWDAESGLHYYRSRYMSPELGRFISSDTIGIWGDVNNLGNGFAYVSNAPEDHTDPTGEGWFKKHKKQLKCLTIAVVITLAVSVMIAATGGTGATVVSVFAGAWAGGGVMGVLGAIAWMLGNISVATVIAAFEAAGIYAMLTAVMLCMFEVPGIGKILR